MELINATLMLAGYTMGIEPSGRELLVVVIKGTFHLPRNGEEVRLHEEQLPLVMANTFTGERGFPRRCTRPTSRRASRAATSCCWVAPTRRTDAR